ncbi:hypothetical protein G9A89_019926 [Geosiphon pyriformis]|nr:hypothetical protein G9A89_019926 [Geosiphon pyriformis]
MLLLKNDFTAAKNLGDLNSMWELLKKMLTKSANSIFSKHWYNTFDYSRNKHSSRFYRLELLIAKIVKALSVGNSLKFVCFIKIWSVLDDVESSKIPGLLKACNNSVEVFKQLSVARKRYHKAKYSKSELTKSVFINKTIGKCIDDFVSEKGNMISSILECSFCKIVLDHLILDRNLILEPAEVKAKVDNIMINWTRKHKIPKSVPNLWSCQYASLDYVVDNAFSGVINEIKLGDLCTIVKNLPDGKAAGLSGVSNKLWKHSSKLPIVLIETACKILSKILSDHISLACSTFDVLRGDNFSVLRGTSTQLPVFFIELIIEDTLEKDSVGWFHLRSSLRRIKITNRIITDFGLSNGYKVLDGLNQGKVFSSLLWKIFYDPLLCEIKSQEHLCEYRIDSRFAGMTFFFAAESFVDNTIWVGSSQVAIQHILDVASKFFALNNIFINREKTPKRVNLIIIWAFFLSTEGLSKLSLLKMHSDVHFFLNVVLCKAISDKQFCYLVSSVLQPIISYRIQFSFIPNAIIRRGLKFKTHFPRDFPTTVLLYLSFYGIKTFAQVQSESKLSSVINFTNTLGILGWLFIHWSLDLQVANWSPVHLLSFYYSVGMPISEVLNDSIFFGVAYLLMCYELDLHGPVLAWFDLAIHFLGAHLLAANVRLCMSVNHPMNSVVASTISEAQIILLDSGLVLFDVYTDSSVKHFGSCSVIVRAAAFFPKFGFGVGAKVQGVMSFTLVELKAIALTLTCVFLGSSVFIHFDSQATLSACLDKLLLACPNFRKNLWIKHKQIVNFIKRKSLAVLWFKVKDHFGILGNKHADEITLNAYWYNISFLTYVNEFFLKLGDLSCNFGSKISDTCNINLMDWKKTFAVWHSDGYMASGYTSHQSAALKLYFMKLLHGHLPVAVYKYVYCVSYLSVKCLFCNKINTFEYFFVCFFDTFACNEILSGFCTRWLSLLNIIVSSFMMVQNISFCANNARFYFMLAKGFMPSNWYHEALDALSCSVVAGAMIIDFPTDEIPVEELTFTAK